MSYAAQEASVAGGAPRELYLFTLGAARWTYTSADAAVEHLSQTYVPLPIRRSAVELSGEFARAALTIELPRDGAPATEWIAGAPSLPCGLTLFRNHRGDAEFITAWKGRVASVTFAGSLARLACEPVFTSLRRIGLRARYQLQCRHALYGPGCNVNNESTRVDGVILAAAGAALTVDAASTKPDGWLVGGYVRVGDERRIVVSHVGGSVTLAAPLVRAAPGDAIAAFAGCDRTLATCEAKFANAANFGGFPWLPQDNPFSGDAIT